MIKGTRRGARGLVLILAMLSTLVGESAVAHVACATPTTAGHSSAVGASVLDDTVIGDDARLPLYTSGNSAKTSATGPNGSATDGRHIARLWGDSSWLPNPGILTVPFGRVDSSSKVVGGIPTSTSSAELNSVSVLGGLVRAEHIRTVATVTSVDGELTTSTEGSVVEGLVINGNRVSVAKGGMTFEVRYPFVDYRPLARVDILPVAKTANGISVTGLRITLIEPLMQTPAGAIINISNADVTACLSN